VSSAGFDQESLVNALGFVFSENLVCVVAIKDGRRLGTSS
jgi:hypothetical protein